MSNIVPQLRQQLTNSRKVVSRYHNGDLTHIHGQLEQLFGERTVQVMLYGAYNAGKSTLVNALLGQEKAPVRDIPTTFQVDRYPWNGLCLLDTPGVNAPVEHEQATAEQVQKCGLMLFVIREGDQDVKGIYERLFGMILGGKQVFIVLNCENSNPEMMAQILVRVNSIMATMGRQYGVDDVKIGAIPVCPVNLSTALNGRLKSSDKLLDYCGYTAFAERLEQWLASYNHETQQMTTLRRAVNELWFQPAWEGLSHKLGHLQDSPLVKLQQSRTILERDKRLLEHTAFTFIQQQVNCKKGEVFGIIDSGGDSVSIQSQLQTLFAAMDPQVEAWLNQQLEGTAGRIATVIGPLKDVAPSQKENNPIAEKAWELARKELSNEENLTWVLKQGRKLKIPLLKGRWEKTLVAWGSKAAVGIKVIMAVHDIYSAGQQENEANRVEQERAISQGQFVEAVCADVLQSLYTSVMQQIDPVFSQRIAEVDSEINGLINQQGELQWDQEYLAKAMGELA